MNMKKNSIILVTGGTGGHVIPAVNFGNYLIKKGAHAIASPVTLVLIAKTLIVRSNKTIAQMNMLNTTK